MAGCDSPPSRLSYAWQNPALRKDAPVSLRELRALRVPFDHARDPYISAQLKAMEKTEAQRREEGGRGSMMVKRHRPFPELRPRNEDRPIRAAFNQAWFREQRAAKLAHYRAQAQEKAPTAARPGPAPQRGR